MKHSLKDNNSINNDYSHVEKRKKLKKKIRIYKIILSLLLSSGAIAVGTNSNAIFDKNIYDESDNLIVSETEIDDMLNDLSIELNIKLSQDDLNYLMLYSIFSNKHLTEIDKDKVYKLMLLINDNKYLDKDKAYKNLTNLKIKYNERDKDLDNSVTGIYNNSKDTIEIYEDNRNNDVLYHELIHCLFSNENTENLPVFFSEGMAELLENEYFSEMPYLEESTYVYEVLMIKILCELTSSDNVLMAFSTGDINYITKDLSDNCSYNLEDVNRIFMNMDALFRNDSLSIDEDVFTETMNLLNEVYAKKIDNKNFDRNNCKYLINLFDGISYNSRYLVYFYNLEEIGVSTKIYFNSSIKDFNYSIVPYNQEYNNTNDFCKK